LELADIVERRFREALPPQASAGDWYLFGSGDGDDLSALARAADLVIYGQNSPDFGLPAGFDPEDVILACGRPVLVVPFVGDFLEVGRSALVAWDGSREAARAAHDALPLLAEAEQVTLLMVSGSEADFERDRPGLDRIVRNYERHGIRSRPEHAVRGDLPISDLLLSRAGDLAADMIVAGAYHHSQLRETIFGGVTRDLLAHMTVPVLMSR
jgi:nucleotide-binding universal stress UspA family protein